MIGALFNFAFQGALVLVCIWLMMGLLGLKWRVFQSLRRGYGSLLKSLALGTAGWLWAPEMQRQGGGYIAQTYTGYEGKSQWVESEEDGLP
jgi:hypothetical protein